MIGIALCLAMAAVYLAAVRDYGRRYPRRKFGAMRVVFFLSGAALLAAAFSPPFERWADASFAAHMAQHVIMTLVAPPLMLLGAPLLLLVAIPQRAMARRIAAVAQHPVAVALLAPAAGWLIFIFVLWGTHFSPLYEAALEHEPLHVVEHGIFLLAAFLFWMPIVEAGYAPRPIAYPARMLYLFLALPQGAFLGLAIYSSRQVLYPHYAHVLSFTHAIDDQRAGGAVMWIVGGFLLFLAFMITAGAWAYAERREESPA